MEQGSHTLEKMIDSYTNTAENITPKTVQPKSDVKRPYKSEEETLEQGEFKCCLYKCVVDRVKRIIKKGDGRVEIRAFEVRI